MKGSMTEKIEVYISEQAGEYEYKIVDLDIKPGRRLALSLVLDKEGGITLDECASFNRNIVSWLEEEIGESGNFVVDVCSPGLDRELKSESSFVWAVGKNIKIITREKVEGGNVLNGRLTERTPEGNIVVETEAGSRIIVQRNNINKVKLVPGI